MSGYYGTRTPGDLAYGGPTGLRPSEPAAVDLDEYLKSPEAREPLAKAQPTHARTRVRAQAPQLAVLPAAAPQAEPTTAVPADQAPATPQAAAPSSDSQRYAAREAQSSQQQQYRGGDVLVISVSTLLVVLLIVLIVMLLT
jgi:hypothetical protein